VNNELEGDFYELFSDAPLRDHLKELIVDGR
jgi:hypothetical protein